jgi:dihydroorotate dehydrogenase (fumarate)
MSDLSTTYLGLKLRSPLVCSSGPLCQDLSALRQMEDAGAGAVVLHSLFEEQIHLQGRDLDRWLNAQAESSPEALTYLPDMADYNLGPEGYLEHIREVKSFLTMPVIASLNGHTRGGWLDFARQIQEAGADALELNVYEVPTDTRRTGPQVEQDVVELVQELAATVSLPLAVKLGPFYSAFADLALRLDGVGARGVVMFNRFYQPDFDLERLDVVPTLRLSDPSELLLRLHWAAILYGNVRLDLAVTGGVHSGRDVLKSLMAGATVAMTTSALMRHGVGRLTRMLDEARAWMADHEYESTDQMRGSLSMRSVADPQAFERANYLKVLRAGALQRER